ncbi:MAG: Pr6Pr family membrane protein [Clostridia bacterium]|nr:Pr6Pr family membrane protein [Clostridia bacterium]
MRERGSAPEGRPWGAILVNFLIFFLALLGFFLSCLFAKRDGYSHWLTRPLYFTQQSNLWIGITSLVFAVMLLRGRMGEGPRRRVSVFKYIFTVSITVTCLIFCTVLAPFAEPDYNAWTVASILTHVAVPLLSIFDFFADRHLARIDRGSVPLSLIPPFLYFAFASVLCLLRVDFGRGDPYPYFFMDFYSEVGLFGFVAQWPPRIGSFYWFVFFLLLLYLLGVSFRGLHARLSRKREATKAP